MKSQVRQRYRQLLASTLIIGGAFSLVAPVLAEGTAAGTPISNTATATYEDPASPGTTLNATSNTVTVTVAEVAGITVTGSSVGLTTDVNGNGKVERGDTVSYVYNITNVGNDPTRFRIPNLVTVTGPGNVVGNLEVSTNGGTSWTPISGTELITGSILPGSSVLVRAAVQVNSSATTGSVIAVKLGQTPGDQQNQLRSPDGGDVYTVDNPNGTGAPEVDGDPVNGTREASITQQVTVDATTQALATVLKSLASYSQGTNLSILTDDTLTYNLGLRVESTAPVGSGGLVAGDLAGTAINLDGTSQVRVLVSDALPAGTALKSVVTPPAGWTVVYSVDDPAVTNKAANDPTVLWTITPPPLSTVKRVGFIANGPVARGTNVSFQFAVSPTTDAGGQVANIAQVFGQTVGGTTLVYDESGDQSPSNFNDDGTPGSQTPTTGITDPAIDGIDGSNNNTGSGPGGEATVFNLNPPGQLGVLAGPKDAPAANGPTGNNDDFTNKSTPIPANLAPNQPVDPAAVGFTNTVQNTGDTTVDIKLLPTAPADPTALPNGTTVTITYGSVSAVYTYNNGVFSLDPSGNPIVLAGIQAGARVDYGVEIDLPSSAQLVGYPVPVTAFVDNDGDGTIDATEPQNITINRLYTGFLKLVKKTRILQGTGPVVGTGQGDFETTPGVNGVDPNPAVADVQRAPAPGNIIEYRIEYTNISTTGGTGSVLLNAGRVVITEDGTAGGNTWALDNDSNTIIDTSNVVGSAIDSGASTINFFSGNPATASSIDKTGTTFDADVTKYVNEVTGTVSPGISRMFQFQRKVN